MKPVLARAIGVALDDDGRHVVVQPVARHAAERLECGDVQVTQRLEPLVVDEAAEDPAREPEHDHERIPAQPVDPELGRIAFHPDESPRGVWVSYFYGFSADIGGGEYRRPLRQVPQTGQFSEFDFKDLASLAKQFNTPLSPLNTYLTENFQKETKDLFSKGQKESQN